LRVGGVEGLLALNSMTVGMQHIFTELLTAGSVEVEKLYYLIVHTLVCTLSK